MPKKKLTAEEVAIVLAGLTLERSAGCTQEIGGNVIPKESFLKKTFSAKYRKTNALQVLKLNLDIVIAHIAGVEHDIERSGFWDERDNSDIIGAIRRISFQAIAEAFENAGCAIIDANFFVREPMERLAVYDATKPPQDFAEAKKDELPTCIGAADLIACLGGGRILSYKDFLRETARSVERGTEHIDRLPQAVYAHWWGRAERDWEFLQFSILLSASLATLGLAVQKFCWSIEIV